MRAERDRRATILTAEGVKQSQILTAEGEKQAAVLRPRAPRTQRSCAPRARRGRSTVLEAIHEGAPDQSCSTYQYLQMLPQLAHGEANKICVIPSEFTAALAGLTARFADGSSPPPKPKPRPRGDDRRRPRRRGRRRGGRPRRCARPTRRLASATPTSHTGPRELPPAGPRGGRPPARRPAAPRAGSDPLGVGGSR